MTREEAKEVIEDIIIDVRRTTAEEDKALRMAIEALTADTVSREECNCVFSKPTIKLPKKAVEFNFSNVEIVVRCKDCIWGKAWNDKQIFCDRILMRLRETDFCSYGERREPSK